MSHIVTVNTEVKNVAAIHAACRRLGLDAPEERQFKMYGSQTATGVGVRLKGWQYPVVFDKDTGKAEYDNYNGARGPQARFNEFMQAYAIEAAKLAAAAAGKTCYEQPMPNGGVRLVIEDGPGREIRVDAAPDGSPPKVETDGYMGVGCKEASRIVTQGLGGIASDDAKSEFYCASQQNELEIDNQA